MEAKKISFGFKKVQRATDSKLSTPVIVQEERKDYIECVEENAIKVVGGEIIEEHKPLIIPMKPNTLTAERFQQIAAEVEAGIEDTDTPLKIKPEPEEPKLEHETLEQQAARELLEEAKKVKNIETEVLTLPVTTQNIAIQKEATLEDYESVPIADYGMAMLRGMGWTPGQASKYKQPTLRPKGLGLGADKLVKKGSEKKKTDSGGGDEEIKLKKGCFVRVLAGKYASTYGKVVSLNDENARAIIELALGREQVDIGEQLLRPVSRAEYDERSKVINSDKYEEYKKKEQIENNEKASSSKKFTDKSIKSTKPSHHEENRYDYKDSKNKQKDNSSDEEDMLRNKNSKSNKRSSSSENDYSKKDNFKQNCYLNERENGSDKLKKDIKSDNRDSTRRSSQDKERDISDESKSSSSSLERSSKKPSKTFERNRHDRSHKDDKMEHQYKDRKFRRISTSSEDSRSRRKHKSKHKQRDLSSKSESLTDSSCDERSYSKKGKKKRSEYKAGRDIDKKRKGKKKKRDRDRSPQNRKHKK